jgi:DNA polymerase I
MKGETVCVFYDKFRPYFYLHTTEDLDSIMFELEKNDLNVEIVDRIIPIGYQEPVKMIKITGKDPSKTPELRAFVKKFGQPYEADVLFKYRFMVDLNLRGMEWIDVKGNFRKTTTVKCKAFEAEEIKPIEILENAPLKYLSVDIECLPLEDRVATPDKDPIIMISLAFSPEHRGMKDVVLVSRLNKKESGVINCSNEKELLEQFYKIVNEFDPDFVIGYNINNFDFPYLIKRMEVLKTKRDFGRSEKNPFTHKMPQKEIPYLSGRIVVDAYDIIKRDPWVKFKRYNLGTIAKEMLGEEKVQMGGPAEIGELWTKNNLEKLISYARKDAELALKLVIQKRLLDKFFQLAKISGLLLQDSFGGQTQRIECMLLHVFRDKKIVMPLKSDAAELRKRNEEREGYGLKGALVLEPRTGLHNSVLVLDYKSLYPSLIKTYNICPTTLLTDNKNIEYIETPFKTKFVTKNIREGILPLLLRKLIDTRVKVKNQMKIESDPEKKRVLNAKQLALKDLSNSMYGFTGYIRSRLYVLDIANTITSYGRETITKTKKMIEENFPVEVLYSDTDSVFIKTNINDLDELKSYGQKISEFVTKQNPGLELQFEKIYKTFLILSKKRYAGWSFETDNGKWKDNVEMKGIETVRRDWCTLTSDIMMEVINTILKEGDVKKAAKQVREVIIKLSKGVVPLEKLSIVKGITKPLEDYDGIQPHVELAKKIIKRDPTRKNIVGERLEFVIVKGNQLLSKRAEDPTFVKEKGLEIDPQYYIENQILPPLERIFDVCGVSSSELMEGMRQQSLMEIFNGQKPKISPEETVLNAFESVVCKNCSFSFRRPTLNGLCPTCNLPLYFSYAGSIGKIIDPSIKL